MDRIEACFLKPFGKLKLTEIDKRRVKKWRDGRIDDGLAKKTIDRDVSTLSALMRHAMDEEIISAHPFAGLKPLHSARKSEEKIVRAPGAGGGNEAWKGSHGARR